MMDVLQLRQEPLVNVRHLTNLVDTIAPVKGRSDGKYTLVGGIQELFVNIRNVIVLQGNVRHVTMNVDGEPTFAKPRN